MLRFWRQWVALAQDELAARVGVSSSTIGRLERGGRTHAALVQRLTEVLVEEIEAPIEGTEEIRKIDQSEPIDLTRALSDRAAYVARRATGGSAVMTEFLAHPLYGLSVWRVRRELSIEQLAERARTARTLRRLEGGATPTLATTQRLAATLGVEPHQLQHADLKAADCPYCQALRARAEAQIAAAARTAEHE